MTSKQNFTRSGRDHPCPVCGRTKDADCSISTEMVLCHNNTGHKPGKHIQNGWAYTRDSSDGRCGVFVLDKPFKRRWKR